MDDEKKGGLPDRDGSPDRTTRVDGDRVIHTTEGALYHGDRNEPPRGLTSEQADEQRSGTKLDERQTREAAFGENQSSASGSDEHQRRPPTEHPEKDKTEDVSDPPFRRRTPRPR